MVPSARPILAPPGFGSDLVRMLGSPFVFLILLTGALTSGCRNPPSASSEIASPSSADFLDIPYDFEHPTSGFALPAVLVEISGLSAIDSTELAAVQDELGVVFGLSRETAATEWESRFAGRGDFEGVEVVAGHVWAIRSDGMLFVSPLARSRETASIRYDLNLHGNCDAEGLAFDAARNRLLIPCKEHPGRGLGQSLAIYAFDLGERRRQESPAYLIPRHEVDLQGQRFKPSALAVHPRSGQIYVLSSVRKLLIVLDPTGQGHILAMRELPPELFRQPEGLAFFPDGTLFISNEGVNGLATLLGFTELNTAR